MMASSKMVLTVALVDEILWCDHSNGVSLVAISHGTICFLAFQKKEIGNFVEF